MNNKKLLFICWIFFLLVQYKMNAQVSIGSASPPQDFSLLEIVSNVPGGLRLPRLSTAERDNKLMTKPGFIAEKGMNGLATGLIFYNTDTRCIEYWNSNKWVSLCLGTANISLDNSCKQTEPTDMVAADGSSSGCIYTPSDQPACIVPSGQAYQVYLTAGSGYASLSVDPLTSAFSIEFEANNTSNVRSAVVRVVNNCSGEFQDFVFQQEGALCPDANNPTINTNSAILCNSGKVFVHVTNPDPDIDYVWSYGNTIIHTGTYLEADRVGEYRVYAGLLGCGSPAILTLTASTENAQPAPIVAASNSGILCGTGSVVLTATNTNGNPVQWYHNGVPHGTATMTPLTVAGTSMSGEWFAAVKSGSCYSASSNKIILKSESGINLAPPKATVNGQDLLSSKLILCQGESLSLTISNAADYTPGTRFEWFANGISIGSSTNTSTIYSLPSNINNVTLSVQASYSGGACPATMISNSTNITFAAPVNTTINNGANEAYICGNTPALLVASYSGGTAYEWFLNKELVASTLSGMNNYSTTTKGMYTVRYKDKNGCWSKLSAGINVNNSNAINIEWGIAPKDQEIVNSIRNYSVLTAPPATQYIWSAPGTVSISPFGDGNSAAIQFPSNETNTTISVQAINGCGMASLSKPVEIVKGCSPVGALNILPQGATLETGQSLTFTASTLNAETYQWTLNGNIVSTESTYTYNATNATDTPAKLTVVASRTSDCVSSETASVNITVNPRFVDIAVDNSGNYTLNGKTCFDVNMTSSATCGAVSSRINSFEPSLSFDYTFSSKTTPPAVKFYNIDPDVLLQSAVQNGLLYTITFRPDIRQYIATNGTKALDIVAVFMVAGQQRKLQLTLNIKDCACCGAYIAPGVWKDFMCHNLGADNNLDPFIPVTGTLGDMYQWGKKDPAAKESTPQRAPSWNKIFPVNGSWVDNVKTANDPCPEGYRVPTKVQFDGLYTYNKRTNIGTWDNSLTNYNSAAIKLGDLLVLPMAGYRDTNGTLTGRSFYGDYWTSTSSGTQLAYRLGITSNAIDNNAYSRILGMSIRCIAE